MLKYCLFFLFVTACNRTAEKNSLVTDIYDNASLIISDIKLDFETDSLTQSSSNSLFLSTIKGEQYLSYLNRANNEIIIFDVDSKRQLFKIKPSKEGPNGVGTINGFYIKSLDSIFIAPFGKRTVYIIDSDANVVSSINYGTSGESPSPNPIIGTTMPLVLEGNNLYLPALPMGNWSTYKSYSDVEVCCVVDLEDNSYKYLPMTFPKGYISKGRVEPIFNRLKVGEKFVYSWFADHKVYTTVDHNAVIDHWAGSEFFDEFKYYPDNMDMEGYMKYYCETPCYTSITFDQYRKVYYRFSSLGIDVETNDNLTLIARFNPNSSIIILDSLFNKIGETKLPYGRFNINEYFVSEEGLYLSENSPLNVHFTDDNLRFTLLELKYDEE